MGNGDKGAIRVACCKTYRQPVKVNKENLVGLLYSFIPVGKSKKIGILLYLERQSDVAKRTVAQISEDLILFLSSRSARPTGVQVQNWTSEIE